MAKRKPQLSAPMGKTYRANQTSTRKRILILCEGKQTEPLYFNALMQEKRVNGVAIGTGRNALSLVKYAKEQRGEGATQYAEVWCVFDRDEFPAEQFDNAIHSAEGHEFLRVAWSNEAFELWYVLHFEYLNSSTGRQYYLARLKALLGDYRKAQPNMYTLLKARMETAQSHAQKLVAEYAEDTPFHDRIPCTTVHELVARLEEYAAEKPY